jgi:hypothetical protein
MSKPFLRFVADHIFEHHKDTMDSLCIVLPGKRAATFLKRHLAEAFGKTIWVPHIITAEELVTELSGLQVAEEIDLLCLLYESYRALHGEEAETFESFARWGNLILQDFNEIDRYLADPAQLYENLKDIKVIENWSLGEEVLTPHQEKYLQFMGSIGAIYRHYSQALLDKKQAYQGLAYRKAVDHLKEHPFIKQWGHFLFCGFNALNEAELRICKHLKTIGKGSFLWDADHYYLDDKDQEAGLFLRRNFEYFDIKHPETIGNDLSSEKDIHIVSVPRQIGQAQVVRQSLEALLAQGITMDKVALVLANEKLLWPVLQQLPAAVEHVNITMEYPLRYTSSYSLVEQLLNLQISYSRQNRQKKNLYYSELISLLRHPLLQQYYLAQQVETKSSRVIAEIKRRNLSFISASQLQELLGEDFSKLSFLFLECSVDNFIKHVQGLLSVLKEHLAKHIARVQSRLELEYLHLLDKNFNRLAEIIVRYPQFKELQNFRQLYQQSLGSATAPFIGEPLRGLQIMGVLETRTLDFDHLIIVNVNEGILPAGKTISSFIPNDLKRAFGLPLYLEKDAIYAYHFYRLLQRAKQITITCDSETDSFGKGEKSRFITQLQLELSQQPLVHITESVAVFPNFLPALSNVIEVPKTGSVFEPLFAKARSNAEFGGLSPSGLINFKECPLRFYYRYSAGLKESIQVEESAEAGTFGSILHLSLENLYSDYLEKNIPSQDLAKKIKLIPAEVEKSFESTFGNRIHSGKLVLQQEVIKVYVEKLVKQDLNFISQLESQSKTLQLLGLEKEYTASLQLTIQGQAETFYIKGKVDRIDRYEGSIRIIDYKSSVKDTDKFDYDGMQNLFEDVRYNKQLQLFMYAWLLHKNGATGSDQVVPCIIPFKKFRDQPLFIKGEDKSPLLFTDALLQEFECALIDFISRIFDPAQNFTQTDDAALHEYCPYNAICQIS